MTHVDWSILGFSFSRCAMCSFTKIPLHISCKKLWNSKEHPRQHKRHYYFWTSWVSYTSIQESCMTVPLKLIASDGRIPHKGFRRTVPTDIAAGHVCYVKSIYRWGDFRIYTSRSKKHRTHAYFLKITAPNISQTSTWMTDIAHCKIRSPNGWAGFQHVHAGSMFLIMQCVRFKNQIATQSQGQEIHQREEITHKSTRIRFHSAKLHKRGHAPIWLTDMSRFFIAHCQLIYCCWHIRCEIFIRSQLYG